jgi:hypothetical protein
MQSQQPPPPLPPQGPPPPMPGAMPGQPVAYAPPGVQYPSPHRASDELGAAQTVFDTVTGPNVRMKDNLIQLLCVIAGAALGAAGGFMYGGRDRATAIVIGVAVGLLLSLILSGAVIGVVRFITAVRKK